MTALGIALLLVGATLVVIETHVSSLGVLGAPGAVALVAGAVLAVSGLGGGLALILVTALLLAGCTLGLLTLTLHKGASARRRRIRSGAEGLVGQIGVVRSWGEPVGQVLVGGALWRARRVYVEDEPAELHAGDEIVVERINGLTLGVRRAEDWELIT